MVLQQIKRIIAPSATVLALKEAYEYARVSELTLVVARNSVVDAPLHGPFATFAD